MRKPTYGQVYLTTGAGDKAVEDTWDDHETDERRWKSGNCFGVRTKRNRFGNHIDDVRKMMALALRGPGTAVVILRGIRHGIDVPFGAGYDPERAILAELDKEKS